MNAKGAFIGPHTITATSRNGQVRSHPATAADSRSGSPNPDDLSFGDGRSCLLRRLPTSSARCRPGAPQSGAHPAVDCADPLDVRRLRLR